MLYAYTPIAPAKTEKFSRFILTEKRLGIRGYLLSTLLLLWTGLALLYAQG
jgi:hypothetical protein